ncbi:hypothetical protein BV22DRAFT_840955 [Leucogyrophana mollusca]|uniref:Uncharacterized protein n=1 Tax=Leucogyrophana mollusca TaxID=85980 RepID=A0ACB8B3W8_9AGAM|nr:hypothetical protein BV22DRAFT_840955 [Leucogyrophana mollusca]
MERLYYHRLRLLLGCLIYRRQGARGYRRLGSGTGGYRGRHRGQFIAGDYRLPQGITVYHRGLPFVWEIGILRLAVDIGEGRITPMADGDTDRVSHVHIIVWTRHAAHKGRDNAQSQGGTHILTRTTHIAHQDNTHTLLTRTTHNEPNPDQCMHELIATKR